MPAGLLLGTALLLRHFDALKYSSVDRRQEYHGVFVAKPLQAVSRKHGAGETVSEAQGKLIVLPTLLELRVQN